MRLLVLTEIQSGISKSQVREIIFGWSVNVASALHIVTHGTRHKERVTQIVEPFLHRVIRNLHVLHCSEGIDNLSGISQAAHSRCHDINQLTQFRLVLHMIASYDV